MSSASKSFHSPSLAPPLQLVTKDNASVRRVRLAVVVQIGLVYALIEGALWTSTGLVNFLWILAAVICILLLVHRASFTLRDMGIAIPPAAALGRVMLGGVILAAGVPLLAAVLGDNAGPVHHLTFPQTCLYAVWALVQEFVLQSFFYIRLESTLGGRRAVVLAAALFGLAHVPNFVLAFASFAGGLFFCEMFRRYRNILPLGLVHATLGWLVAASFSDSVMRHMRVGIGYIRFHPGA